MDVAIKAGIRCKSKRVDTAEDGSFREPDYLGLFRSGILEERVLALDALLSRCELCPRRCGVDRKAGEKGFCGAGAVPRVASVNLHPWEEPPVSGTRGSGTIFFSGCTMRCVFCQNYPISRLGVGRDFSIGELADAMLDLQRRGAHNVNLVTPTHHAPAVVAALLRAVLEGFHLPLVYNTSGYERVEILKLLDGIVDVYLPDIKYSDPAQAAKWSGCADYVAANREALAEMWRQTGPPEMDFRGLMRRGMLVRHMVLPEDISGDRECLAFLAERFGPSVWVSLMSQYFPAHKAHELPPLDRKISVEEYGRASDLLDEFGLREGFVQDYPEDEDSE